MGLFSKKEKLYLCSEQQKDDFVEKLENANIKYRLKEDKENSGDNKIGYILSLRAEDLKKVI